MAKQFGGIGPDRNQNTYSNSSSFENNKRGDVGRIITDRPVPEIAKKAIIPLLINLFVFFPIGLIGAYWSVKAMICEFNNDKNEAYAYYNKSKKFVAVYVIAFAVLLILSLILNLFA